MTDQIHIEPAGAQRPAFAAWGLAQDPPLQTATASGWNIPLDLYPDVPDELLEGAYVDGFLYGRPDAVPKAEPSRVSTVPPRGLETPAEAPEAAPLKLPARKPRKRAAGTRRDSVRQPRAGGDDE